MPILIVIHSTSSPLKKIIGISTTIGREKEEKKMKNKKSINNKKV